MITKSIQDILTHHNDPLPLEEEVMDYLVSFLEDLDVDSQDDDTETMIKEMLTQFLTQEECQDIVKALASQQQQQQKQKQQKQPSPSVTKQIQHQQLQPQQKQQVQPTSPTSPTSTTMSLTNNNDHDEKNQSSPNSLKSKKPSRKEKRLQKQQEKRQQKSKDQKHKQEEKEENEAVALDDHASAWKECQEQGTLWGGRGHGGRGIRPTGDDAISNIHLPSVSVSFEGIELLVDSPMTINQGHVYGLLGRNGVGKSTLLRQLANHTIPGMPRNMRTVLVEQHQQSQLFGIEPKNDNEESTTTTTTTTTTTLQALVNADTDRALLLQQQEQVEQALSEADNNDPQQLEQLAQQLDFIVSELDTIDADSVEDRAYQMLKGLSFTKAMIYGPVSSLSGGWRMRLALAQALLVPNRYDLMLLDECTNHLDLQGMDWLIQHLQQQKQQQTIIMVSHDRMFLDAICTDIIVMEHCRLTYYVGNYSEYQRQVEEKSAREAQILDASERQRQKAAAFVQKQQQQSSSSADPNKQRQAKMIKEKKMDRIGNYREDGKRYKLNSLKKLDEKYIRLAQKVHIERDDPVLKLRFPSPTWPSGLGGGNENNDHTPLIQLDHVSFQYSQNNNGSESHQPSNEQPLLKDVTLQVTRQSKVALVGKNGCGKTTLMKLLAGGDTEEALKHSGKLTGQIWRHPNIRIGHVTQYSIEELEAQYADMTVVEYGQKILSQGRASSAVMKEASGNIRQYLGAFGLGGPRHAHLRIQNLSGGERMRLCFATVLADEPHVLLLDESTNHVDLETLDSMASALQQYTGAVVMISHNQGFLSAFCRELWVVEEDGNRNSSHVVQVRHPTGDQESFDDLFSEYRHHILSSDAVQSRQAGRKNKADMARRAAQQTTKSRNATTLLT